MKRTILGIVAFFAMAANVSAQTWNMIVTHEDGSVDTLATSTVKKVSFQLPDQNVDQVIIKELYNGGCPKDEGSDYFQMDKGFVLYNNCGQTAVINNLAVGQVDPGNAHSTNNWYNKETLTYAADGYLPVDYSAWYFQKALVMGPYSQVVVSCMGAIDNTQTYKQSVNYANKDYYAMYDPESGNNNIGCYPTPADVIPSSHYLKAVMVGQGNGWPLSVSSPAFIIFQTRGETAHDYLSNTKNYVFQPGKSTANNIYRCVKVPTKWVIDGVEEYDGSKIDKSQKRLTDDVDAGYVSFTSRKGYSVYRNVDVEATKAIAGNAGKLVYNYSLGVGKSTDPSGIDAEASIRNGAKIVYQDTNNSSRDFHLRQRFSVRGK